MSLFSCLEMTPQQIRVMFLERLRNDYENIHLKVSILEFVSTCIGKQPGLTEAFFKIRHFKEKSEEKKVKKEEDKEEEDDDDGVLSYVAHYLSIITSVSTICNNFSSIPPEKNVL